MEDLNIHQARGSGSNAEMAEARNGHATADQLTIEGGHPIGGSVAAGGFKHAMVPMLVASACVDGELTLENVPDIEDARVLASILTRLGARVERGRGRITIESSGLSSGRVPDELSRRIHGSLYLVPTLLARCGEVDLGTAGGCQIGNPDERGERPWRHVVEVLEQFGAHFDLSQGRIRGRTNGYRATTIDVAAFSTAPGQLRGPKVSGATKTALLAAALARGTSVILNPYRRPELEELIALLRDGGVAIDDGGDRIEVEGRPSLRAVSRRLMPDLIELVTFAACATHMRCAIRLTGFDADRVRSQLAGELACLSEMGVPISWARDAFTVHGDRVDVVRGGIEVVAALGSIYSDSHPLFALMLLSGDRPSVVHDKVWIHRFDYAAGLRQLGCRIEPDVGSVRVFPGRPSLAGQRVKGPDLRSAAVLTLAALGVSGRTTVEGTAHLDRGYDDLVGKLRALGARVAPTCA
jgi:UDP-N-acetylglucosamine 1-carboxyvinyltransferase